MTRVELPGGAWAELRGVNEVSERLRRPVVNLCIRANELGVFDEGADGNPSTPSTEGLEVVEALQDHVCVALIASWSFDLPITVDTVVDIPGPAYDALRVATAPLFLELMPDFGPSNPSDRTTPTGA